MAERKRAKGRKSSKASKRDKADGGKSSSGKRRARAQRSRSKKSKGPAKAGSGVLLMKALAHPLRLQILAIVSDRMASPKEISDELNAKIGNVSYHAKVLLDVGLVVEDHQVPRRGAVEHFYRAATPTVIPPGAWEGFPDVVRKGVSGRILKAFLDDAGAAMKAEVFDEPPGELSWTPMILDDTGLDELGALTRDFLDSVLKVQAKATQRLPKKKAERAETARSASVFLASFLSARSPADDLKASSRKRR